MEILVAALLGGSIAYLFRAWELDRADRKAERAAVRFEARKLHPAGKGR